MVMSLAHKMRINVASVSFCYHSLRFSHSKNMPNSRANASNNISILKQEIKTVSGLILASVMLILLSIITYLTEKNTVGNLDSASADYNSVGIPLILQINNYVDYFQNATYIFNMLGLSGGTPNITRMAYCFRLIISCISHMVYALYFGRRDYSLKDLFNANAC